MTDVVYKDYIPANARVIVDYKKEQKVEFSYPIEWSYWKAVRKRAYETVLSFWMALHMCWLAYLMPLILVGGGIFVGYTIFLNKTVITNASTFTYTFFNTGLPIICYLFWCLGIPLIITYTLALKKEWLAKWMPILGYYSATLMGGTKEMRFEKDGIKDKMAIIPIFSNVFLDYKCYGDFNKYLHRVEVIEIPFNFKTRRFFFTFLKKKEKNDYCYRAVFYFDETPQSGKMDVEFI